MNRPLLEIFTTSWNEECTILELISFYRGLVPNCLITVQDNMSTDNTEKLCKDNNVKFTTFDTQGKMDEKTLINLRSNSWKNSEAIYVITCDCDELVDISELELLKNLSNNQWNITKCNGVELFGNDKNIKDANYGIYSKGYSKTVLWMKDAIKESILSPGNHTSKFIPNAGYELKYNEFPPNLYHTKWMDYDKGIKRQNQIKNKGVSQDSIFKGWNFHYNLSDSHHQSYWENGMKNRIKVK